MNLKFAKKSKNTFEQITFGKAYQNWINRVKPQLKPNTIIKYEAIYNNHLALLNEMKIDAIESSDITALTNHLLYEKLSRKTINDILLVLNMILKSELPATGAIPPKIEYLHETKKEMRVLTVPEQKKLTEYLKKDIDIHKFGVLLAMQTGLRIGELCALKWEDISDFSISVSKTMMRIKNDDETTSVIVAPPKSESSIRIIPIPVQLQKYIKRFRGEGYVLSNDKIERTEPRLMQYKFSKYAKDCGLENVSFHCLRHTFATRCIEAGVDAKTVSELLGHSDTKITLRCYVHSSFELKQASIERMEKLLA